MNIPDFLLQASTVSMIRKAQFNHDKENKKTEFVLICIRLRMTKEEDKNLMLPWK